MVIRFVKGFFLGTAFVFLAVGLAAQAPPSPPLIPGTTIEVLPRRQFPAGWLHRALLGGLNRDLWATALVAEVLDPALRTSLAASVIQDQVAALFPGTIGVHALVDVGRVYEDDESSAKFHAGYGGGVWFSVVRADLLNGATAVRSVEGTRLYLSIGFPY